MLDTQDGHLVGQVKATFAECQGPLICRPAWPGRSRREARAAIPRECCGLIEGVRDGGRFRVMRASSCAQSCADAGTVRD